MLQWIVHICLEQFRKDVLSAVRRDIRDEKRSEALRGKMGFCSSYFQEIMGRRVRLVAGNRHHCKDLTRFIVHLFNFDDGLERRHWGHKVYRMLYQRTTTGLRGQVSGVKKWKEYSRLLIRTLLEYHWILPYPNGTQLMQTKDERRVWYSIVTANETPHPLTGRWA